MTYSEKNPYILRTLVGPNLKPLPPDMDHFVETCVYIVKIIKERGPRMNENIQYAMAVHVYGFRRKLAWSFKWIARLCWTEEISVKSVSRHQFIEELRQVDNLWS